MRYSNQNAYIRLIIDNQEGMEHNELFDNNLDPEEAHDITYLGSDYDTKLPTDGDLVVVGTGDEAIYFVWGYERYKEETLQDAKSSLIEQLDHFWSGHWKADQITWDLEGSPADYAITIEYCLERAARIPSTIYGKADHPEDLRIVIDTEQFKTLKQAYESIKSAETFSELGGIGRVVELSSGW